MRRKKQIKLRKSAKKSRKVPDTLLEDLIVPNQKGASNLVASDDDLNDQNNEVVANNGDKYMLMPKGILLQCLKTYYGDTDLEKCEKFQKDLVKQLSLLATEDGRNDALGSDFNEFFKIIISAINLLNKAINRLTDNGIEFDIKTELEDDSDDDN